MPNQYTLLSTLFRSLGVASSLLIAMLSIEFLIVGNLEHVLVYIVISVISACVYLISAVINRRVQKRQ